MKNKLENYRIQEVINGNNESVFYIQERGLFGWRLWYSGVIGYRELEHAQSKGRSMCDINTKYHTIE